MFAFVLKSKNTFREPFYYRQTLYKTLSRERKQTINTKGGHNREIFMLNVDNRHCSWNCFKRTTHM